MRNSRWVLIFAGISQGRSTAIASTVVSRPRFPCARDGSDDAAHICSSSAYASPICMRPSQICNTTSRVNGWIRW